MASGIKPVTARPVNCGVARRWSLFSLAAVLLFAGVLLLPRPLPAQPAPAAAPAESSATDSLVPQPPTLGVQTALDTAAAETPVGTRTMTPTPHGFKGFVGKYFYWDRLNLLIILLVVGGAIFFYTLRATRGVTYKIRKIAGIAAIEEAVGRATEMGRPVLFVPGIQDLDNVQTVAGITILSSVAGRIAEYDAHLEVPTSRSLVMTTARETVKEAYSAAGRPDAYNDDMVYYVTDEQFGYVAHLDGYMVRNKPATCIYMGAFFAESLILAETGYSVGAIQIAGTAMPTQLPFFVAACDYTLIGEELFAASAYLSQDPRLLGSLRGQDFGKVFAMFFIVVGTLLVSVDAFWGGGLHTFVNWLVNVAFGTKG
jgi:hypothetical protein